MRFFRYDIPLDPSVLGLSLRSGILVQTELGWGEITPLPGFSRETLTEAIQDLRLASTPSVQFGLSCAHTLFPLAFPHLPLSGLATSFEEAEYAALLGIKTLKLKIGSLSPNEANLLILRIRSSFSFQLRIDINRKWNYGETSLFFDLLDLQQIEYIEEPFQNPQHLRNLDSIPIALDETLLDEHNEDLLTNPNVVAFILKPTLLGKKLEKMISLAKIFEKKTVFSSSFESAIGLLHLAHLQMQFSPNTAIGLDTYRFFTQNFFPVPTKDGFLINTPLPPIENQWLKEFAL